MEKTLLLPQPPPPRGTPRERKIKHRRQADSTRTQHAGKRTTSSRLGFEMRNSVLGQGDGESIGNELGPVFVDRNALGRFGMVGKIITWACMLEKGRVS